jgi:2-polyprenyl-3-methyl-5-hydroxy-6-metoxy-1,4-benzoquinol methylase
LDVQANEDAARFRHDLRDRMERAYDLPRGAGRSDDDSPIDIGIRWNDLRDAVSATRSSQELVGHLPPQLPTLRGHIRTLVARFMEWLLFWYTPYLVRFQQASVRALDEQNRALERLGRATEALLTRNAVLKKRCDLLEESLMIMSGHATEALLTSNAVLKKRCDLLEESLMIMSGQTLDLQSRISAPASLELPVDDRSRRESERGQDRDTLYLALANEFRGSREEMKQKLRVYLPRIVAAAGSHQMPILDVGCGRGEWLELLADAKVEAIGIDPNGTMVTMCRQSGLNAHQVDALGFLRSQPDASFCAITAFHVIEHLPVAILLELLDEMLRALKPGGIAILETPNPNNIMTATRTFYLDPTHRHPIPPALGRFLAEARGFRNVEILELEPWPESQRMSIEKWGEMAEQWNAIFQGPQDYAIIGCKGGP